MTGSSFSDSVENGGKVDLHVFFPPVIPTGPWLSFPSFLSTLSVLRSFCKCIHLLIVMCALKILTEGSSSQVSQESFPIQIWVYSLLVHSLLPFQGFPAGSDGEDSICNAGVLVGEIPWRRAWPPTPVLLPGESPWTEEPDGLQSTGLQRVGRDWAIKHSAATALGLPRWISGKEPACQSRRCRRLVSSPRVG